MMPDLKSMEQMFLRISEDRFHFLKSILEGYDNIGILSSCPERHGVVVLRFTPGCGSEVLELLGSLSATLKQH